MPTVAVRGVRASWVRAVAMIVAAALAIIPVTVAHADTITVTSNGDSGPNTLHQAIADANLDGHDDRFIMAGVNKGTKPATPPKQAG